jgi:phosphinothricin acetyltransferase
LSRVEGAAWLIREATEEDLPAITAIFNEAILHSTSSFYIQPRSRSQQEAWFKEHGGRHPVLVAQAPSGRVVGWGALSVWNQRCAYAGTAEVSVYVEAAFRRQGAGSALLEELIRRARAAGLHVLIAQIARENSASAALFSRAGFSMAGTLKEVGCKFGRYLDLTIWQLLL